MESQPQNPEFRYTPENFRHVSQIMGFECLSQVNKFILFHACTTILQASRKICVTQNCFSYFPTKTYVVGTQKNRLNEMVF